MNKEQSCRSLNISYIQISIPILLKNLFLFVPSMLSTVSSFNSLLFGLCCIHLYFASQPTSSELLYWLRCLFWRSCFHLICRLMWHVVVIEMVKGPLLWCFIASHSHADDFDTRVSWVSNPQPYRTASLPLSHGPPCVQVSSVWPYREC